MLMISAAVKTLPLRTGDRIGQRCAKVGLGPEGGVSDGKTQSEECVTIVVKFEE